MSDAGQKWLVGCGVGCGLVVLVVVALFAGSFFFLKGSVDRFDEVVEQRTALEERFGEPESFVPAPDGAIPPERMETFLAVRDATTEARAELGIFDNTIRLSVGLEDVGDLEDDLDQALARLT